MEFKQYQKVLAVVIVAVVVIAALAFALTQPAPGRQVLYSQESENSERHALGFIDSERLYVMESRWDDTDFLEPLSQYVGAMRMDGKMLWSREAFVSSSLIGPDKTLYICTSTLNNWPYNLSAIDPDGTTRWSLSDIHAMGMVAADNVLYVAGYTGVQAIAGNGTILWTNWLFANHVTLSSNGTLLAYSEYSITGFNRTSGVPEWTAGWTGDYYPECTIVGERYYGLRNYLYTDYSTPQSTTYNIGGLSVLDMNGTVLWKYPQEKCTKAYRQVEVDAEGRIYLMVEGLYETSYKTDDSLVVLAPNGTILWTYNELHLYGPAMSDGGVMLWNETGLIAFHSDGSLDWKMDVKYNDVTSWNVPISVQRSIMIGPGGAVAVSDLESFHTVGTISRSSDPLPLVIVVVIAVYGLLMIFFQARLRRKR